MEQLFTVEHLVSLSMLIIVLGGGVLIIYTATKEIFHMISIDELEDETQDSQSSPKSYSGS